MGVLIRMEVLIGIYVHVGALINKNTLKGGTYSNGGAYWREGIPAALTCERVQFIVQYMMDDGGSVAKQLEHWTCNS